MNYSKNDSVGGKIGLKVNLHLFLPPAENIILLKQLPPYSST